MIGDITSLQKLPQRQVLLEPKRQLLEPKRQLLVQLVQLELLRLLAQPREQRLLLFYRKQREQQQR